MRADAAVVGVIAEAEAWRKPVRLSSSAVYAAHTGSRKQVSKGCATARAAASNNGSRDYRERICRANMPHSHQVLKQICHFLPSDLTTRDRRHSTGAMSSCQRDLCSSPLKTRWAVTVPLRFLLLLLCDLHLACWLNAQHPPSRFIPPLQLFSLLLISESCNGSLRNRSWVVHCWCVGFPSLKHRPLGLQIVIVNL